MVVTSRSASLARSPVPGSGLAMVFQLVPSQCRVSGASPRLLKVLPTAQASVAETALIPDREPLPSGTVRSLVQLVPSQCRTTGVSVLVILPTAQALLAEVAVTPNRSRWVRSGSEGRVAGAQPLLSRCRMVPPPTAQASPEGSAVTAEVVSPVPMVCGVQVEPSQCRIRGVAWRSVYSPAAQISVADTAETLVSSADLPASGPGMVTAVQDPPPVQCSMRSWSLPSAATEEPTAQTSHAATTATSDRRSPWDPGGAGGWVPSEGRQDAAGAAPAGVAPAAALSRPP